MRGPAWEGIFGDLGEHPPKANKGIGSLGFPLGADDNWRIGQSQSELSAEGDWSLDYTVEELANYPCGVSKLGARPEKSAMQAGR
jgi:hypothetical protein